MPLTAVVFVHGFISSPEVWQPFLNRMRSDPDFPPDRFRLLRFAYPTRLLALSPTRRIPSIRECGQELAGYLRLNCPDATSIFLVGHSMGGLVIEAMIATKLSGNATDLKNIAGVIQFATPNRGSNMLRDTRSILTKIFGRQPQDESLQTLSDDTDSILRDIDRRVLRAIAVTQYTCPIAFQIFYGTEDNIVPEVSARGPFDDATALPGDHSSILHGGTDRTDDPNDSRYQNLKEALLNPLGHPSIHEIKSFDVILSVQPVSKELTFQIPNLDRQISVQTDNVAVRAVTFKFSDKNRCYTPYKQIYRSVNGFVEFLTASSENEASATDKSTYRSEGKIFTYVFTPDHNDTFSLRLRIYNGFGDGNRNWHNHMEQNAHYHSMSVRLDLTKYEAAGYLLSQEPRLCHVTEDSEDHELCAQREFSDALAPLPSSSPWDRTWNLTDIRGGIIDLVWDVKPPAA